MAAEERSQARLEVVVGAAVLVAGSLLLAELWRQVRQLDAGIEGLWLTAKRVAQNTAAGPLLGDTASSLAQLGERLDERA